MDKYGINVKNKVRILPSSLIFGITHKTFKFMLLGTNEPVSLNKKPLGRN